MFSPGSFGFFMTELGRGRYSVNLIGLKVLETVSPGSFGFSMTKFGRGRYPVYLIGV